VRKISSKSSVFDGASTMREWPTPSEDGEEKPATHQGRPVVERIDFDKI